MAIGISQGICQPTGLICQNAFYGVAVCFQRPRLPRLFDFMTEAFWFFFCWETHSCSSKTKLQVRDQRVPRDGDLTTPEALEATSPLTLRGSWVWDTSANTCKADIGKLRFDPLEAWHSCCQASWTCNALMTLCRCSEHIKHLLVSVKPTLSGWRYALGGVVKAYGQKFGQILALFG